MNDLITSTIRSDNIWPTIASIIVPLTQLVAVVIVDVSGTLNLNELFLDAQLLQLANVLFAEDNS